MGRKILVVDDDPQFVDLVKIRLEANDYEVLTAYDGQEALDKAHQEKPDLIILDVGLPKIDGFEVIRKLQAEKHFRNIPVIMLTGRTGAKEIRAGMELGAVSYVQKPFKAELLLGIIHGLISSKEE